LLNDVPSQTARVDALVASSTRLALADVALIEVVFVLERVMKIPRSAVVESFVAIATEKTFSFDRSFWQTVMKDYASHPKLSVADIFLVHEARRSDALPLVTFDALLARQLDGAERMP